MPYENQNNIDDYKLISLVENAPELWQMNHSNYGNSNLKTKIWTRIGSAMGIEPTMCRSRWVNIRDNYRRSMKKNMNENGHKTYKFYDELNFLKPIILEGQKMNNYTRTPIIIKRDSEISVCERSLSPCTNSMQSSITYKRSRSPTVQNVEKLAEKRLSRPESQVQDINVVNASPHDDAVDAFLAGLAPTLKSLSPYYLNLAKTKIFMTVQKYELNMLMSSNNEVIDHEDPYSIYRENQDSDSEQPESPLDVKEQI